jgi:hypothetical protein
MAGQAMPEKPPYRCCMPEIVQYSTVPQGSRSYPYCTYSVCLEGRYIYISKVKRRRSSDPSSPSYATIPVIKMRFQPMTMQIVLHLSGRCVDADWTCHVDTIDMQHDAPYLAVPLA